jgi:hypothetical protein
MATTETTAPGQRGRGRPATTDEVQRARILCRYRERAQARLAEIEAGMAAMACKADDVRETELADLLGVNRGTLRKWKAATAEQ